MLAPINIYINNIKKNCTCKVFCFIIKIHNHEELTMSDSSTPSFEEQVNEVIASATKTDDGKTTFAEGTNEAIAYAATAEMRRRDTQSAFTKSRQKLKALEVENTKLAESWEQDAVSTLSKGEQARLEELKVQDPEKWRQEITQVEEDKRKNFQEKRQAITTEAQATTELERRQAQITAYNEQNPEAQLTDDVIENDIPPRITAKLKSGDISFDEFITQCNNFLTKPKKVATGDKPPKEPAFARSRGSHQPSPEAIAAQDSNEYKQETF